MRPDRASATTGSRRLLTASLLLAMVSALTLHLFGDMLHAQSHAATHHDSVSAAAPHHAGPEAGRSLGTTDSRPAASDAVRWVEAATNDGDHGDGQCGAPLRHPAAGAPMPQMTGTAPLPPRFDPSGAPAEGLPIGPPSPVGRSPGQLRT